MTATAIFEILGGLGVFLFGLRVMSNGLQKVAGNRLRAILGGLTRNRLAGVTSGFLITTAVQSSSATTVLIVSFANAGLLSLVQAIGLVMGANIGTTVTGWMVALLGFKVKISSFALPMIGLAFPLSLIGSARAKQISEIFVGFGLLFLGLAFLKDGVPELHENPEALAFVASFADHGFASTMVFILVGTVVTIVVQSSSATMTITLAMAAKGWIGYDVAAAMVLGENIGTTITAQLAVIGANRNARRVAMSHTVFNLIGVAWMLPIMGLFLAGIDSIVPGNPWDMGDGELAYQAAITAHLAAFHTAFNVINTFMLVWFVPQLAALVTKMIPLREDETEGEHLKFLETGLMGTPELAGVEARRALQQMVGACQQMTEKIEEVLSKPETKLGTVVDEIKRLEARTDDMEAEIVAFCSQLSRAGTSEQLGRNVAIYLEMANDIERMGDFCFNLAMLAQRRYEKGYKFDEEAQKQLLEMIGIVRQFVDTVHRGLGPEAEPILAEAKLLEAKIDDLRNKSRKREARKMQEGVVQVREGLIFLDMMTNMEKLGDYCFNVAVSSKHLAVVKSN
ncbi:MAG TPA: Na/Pi cotransporter family protein [Kofleriaceae bacterium]|nr:Na/Pi cotransporter family protein [Kofleriaceae bacterium]